MGKSQKNSKSHFFSSKQKPTGFPVAFVWLRIEIYLIVQAD
jgi:hypothetical protein